MPRPGRSATRRRSRISTTTKSASRKCFASTREDTLVFHVTLRNKSDQEIRYLPESFCVRVGNRLYYQSISDAPGRAAAEVRQHGLFRHHRHAGRRAQRAVAQKRVHRAGDAASPAATASGRQHQPCRPTNHNGPAMKPRDFLNFFKTKTGKLVLFVRFSAAVWSCSACSATNPAALTTWLSRSNPPATNATDKPQVVQSVELPMQPFHPPTPKPEPLPVVKTNDAPKVIVEPPSSRKPAAPTLRAHQPVCRCGNRKCRHRKP